MKLQNIIMTNNVDEIIRVIQQEIYFESNKVIFKIIKNGMENIQVTCPFHKLGNENKPSFGISKENGKCNCFTCGWKGDLISLINLLFGHSFDSQFGKKWILRRFQSQEILTRQKIEFDLSRNNSKNNDSNTYITESELKQYRIYHDYMWKRKLSKRIVNIFDVGYDIKTDCLTFPVYDSNGNCLFIARRSVKSKYFNYPTGIDKPVYGLNFAKNYKKVYITESILNCLTLWKLGLPSVSLLGLGSKYQYDILRNSDIRHFVLALDPDMAGQKAQEKLREHLHNKVITQLQYQDDINDINDLDIKCLTLKEIL